ncbi:MAG: (d)CMP kinase [Mycobacteriales bacterium]
MAPSPEQLTHVVALDGPAGSGKSTVSRLVAARLGWRFVDTGATYRALTLAALRAGADVTDPVAVERAVADAEVVLSTDPAVPTVRLDGEDVSQAIRGAEVTAAVSAVSAHPNVRARLVTLQRQAMGTAGAVVEGRDIATVVAPRALVKVYLDARPDVRARRRAGDHHAGVAVQGISEAEVSARVARDLARRDGLDSQTNRLEVSDGAVHLDTSDLSLDQVVDLIVEMTRAAVVEEHSRQEPEARGTVAVPLERRPANGGDRTAARAEAGAEGAEGAEAGAEPGAAPSDHGSDR